MFSDGTFQKVNVRQAVVLCHTDLFTEIPDRLRRVAAAAIATDRGHAWIIPAGDVIFLDEGQKFTFAQNRVSQI